MTTARDEAERRYKERWSSALSAGAARDARVDAFDDGALWQAQQPVEITDAMIERATRVWVESGGGYWAKIPEATCRRARARFRAVLEAALGGEA